MSSLWAVLDRPTKSLGVEKGEWWLKAQGDSLSDIILLGIEQNQFGAVRLECCKYSTLNIHCAT